MAYIGNTPAEAFSAFQKQDFTTSATTSYTLDHPVSNQNEIALFINFVRQEPTAAYTASGTTLTLTSATSSSDDMYCVYLVPFFQTVNPPNSSVGSSQVSADLITGQTALGATPADTDELLISDAGTLKRVDYSYLKSTNTAEFLATVSTEVTLTHNSFTKVTFQTESYDPDGVYDNSTNYRFTAPSAGKYMLYANVVTYDASTDIQENELAFYKNGSKFITTNWQKNSGGRLRNNPLTNTVVLDLAASDYIEVFVYVNTVDGGNAAAEASSNRKNYFGGYKLLT
jgi:hypothetical protein